MPPPAVLLALAYGAGLLTGPARFGGTACVAGACFALLWRRSTLAWLAGAVSLGAAASMLAQVREASGCAMRLPAGSVAMTVRLLEPVPADGGMARVRPLEAGCQGSVLSTWPRGAARWSGEVLRVRATWHPGESRWRPASGLLRIRPGAGAGRAAPSLADRVRNAAAIASRRLYGHRAGLVDALVLGQRGAMDRELRDDFAASGLVHLLSISGFHVGLLAGWVVLAMCAVGASRVGGMAIGAAVATSYVGLLGWPGPALRAAALLWLLTLLRWRQRAALPDALLGVTALVVLLVDPWAITDLGAWLSVLSLWGAVRFARWTQSVGGAGWHWQAAASSIGATAATAPVTAAVLGTVAPVGIGLNFVAIPLAALAVPGVFASLLLLPVAPWLAQSLAAGAGLGLHLLEWLARVGSRVPGGHVVMPTGAAQAVPWAAALGVLCWAITGSAGIRAAGLRLGWGAAALLWGALLLPPSGWLRQREPGLGLHFLDVGQGDAAVVLTPGGHAVLVDAGPRSERDDAGRRVVVPWLRRVGVRRVAVLLASHGHLDHVGGAAAVYDRLTVDLTLEPQALLPDPAYRSFLAAMAAAGGQWGAARPGVEFTLDGVRFRIVHPDPSWARWGLDANDDSAVLLVEYRGFRALLAGDAGEATEAALRGRIGPVDLLKVGHHGSATSTGAGWLAELQPRVAVISVGRNSYGHPSPAVLARLGAQRASVWRTDRDGTVSVVTDGRRTRVTARRRAELLEAPDRPSAPIPIPR